MPHIYPFMGYKDARVAIEWLCGAFGFEKHAIYDGQDGRVHQRPKSEVLLWRRRRGLQGGCIDMKQAVLGVRSALLALAAPLRSADRPGDRPAVRCGAERSGGTVNPV
jgi:hypothetical protein